MRAVYDLSRCPPTFDVVSFLMSAEAERIKRGAEEMKIDVLPGPRGGFRADTLWPQSIEERKALKENVVLPMCRSLPSAFCVTDWGMQRPKECEGHFGYGKYSMQFQRYVEAYRLGVRPLRPGGDVEKQPDLVTITLRECEHWTPRNSNLREWIGAARHISFLGYRVLFIRDTRMADVDLKGFSTAPIASRDLIKRGAIYRAAFCNLGINNGPMWFAMASDAPTIMIKPTCEELGACYGAQWFKACGVKAGEQFPNAPSHQRIVWQEDTADNIIPAFNEFRGG